MDLQQNQKAVLKIKCQGDLRRVHIVSKSLAIFHVLMLAFGSFR
jgi:hypothetical protein